MKPNTTELDNPLCECANCGLRTKADDLDHWCDRQGSVDFNDELNHAANMYHEETAEP